MRARVNHFTGNKLHYLRLNCFSKCCFSIFILFSFGFASTDRGSTVVFFLLHTDMHIYRIRNETFCFSHGDCVNASCNTAWGHSKMMLV